MSEDILAQRAPASETEGGDHRVVYDAAALYHLAFSYRDFAAEVAFLIEMFRRRLRRAPRSFFDLAAGPAWHAIEMGKQGVAVYALDRSASMARFATAKGREEGVELTYLVADMVSFEAPREFEFAASMLRSSSYLCSDEDFIGHLRSVARCLMPGGLYVLEMARPPEPGDPPAKSVWSTSDDNGVLDAKWEEQGSPDLRARTRRYKLRLAYQPKVGKPTIVEDTALQRDYSRQQLEALVERSGVFRIDEILGELDAAIGYDHPEAWRIVAILERV